MKLHKNMNNQEITRLLRAVAAAYEVNGESLFRIRAYENAADSIEHQSREVRDLWEEGRLRDLPGIGENIASHLAELFRTGNVKHFKQVFNKLPEAMFELIEIPGIGPKTAYKLTKSLGITKAKGVLQRLKQSARKGKIRDIEGFGEESEEALIKGIEEYERRENRMQLPQANQLAKEIISYIKKEKSVIRIDPLGSLRRRVPTVGDIDIAIATDDPSRVVHHFTRFPNTRQVIAAGTNTARIIHQSGRQIDIKTQTPERYGAMLQHFTGSKAHNIHLREIALDKGFSLSEHGIKKRNKIREFRKEHDFYRALGMQWIPPELREDTGEIEMAIKEKLPKLLESHQIKGDLHLHTNYNWKSSHDAGSSSMHEMVKKAIKLGYRYIGVGDHNPSTSAYNQSQIISEVKKRKQHLEDIMSSHENSRIKVLNTLEVDIFVDGKLAIPDQAMEMLDYAIVSIHSSMRMSKTEMTQRIIKGLTHRKAKILGHPTGRLLNKREGYEADWEKIFAFAKENNKFIEINAWPTRLDLPDTLVRRALKAGVQLAINTDSHSEEHMELMRYGIDVARRGWAESGNILNTLPYNKLKKALLK